MIHPKHFYMIRHGQTEANAAKVMAGSLDSPLTALGRAQARAVHAAVDLMPVRPKTIIHSHLSRARDTAAIINEALNLPMHEDRDYAEIHTGEWEGRSHAECPDPLSVCTRAQKGESPQDFVLRVRTAKNRALERPETPILIVSHGGVFRAFLKLYDIHIEGVRNCQLYEFEPDTTAPRFPWKVWHYKEVEGQVTRSRAEFT